MKRPVTEQIPEYLLTYIAKQDPSLYTPIDHASWRFILRISTSYFSKHAHAKYLRGLVETGISAERIPLVDEMDQCLRRFGWRAVAVSGFIPPAVFMEFQSLGILPIACEMRTLEHLAYTPAPDIVHEAAGHAPIIADAEYAEYLRDYGEISRKAIFSSKDMDVYQAIRELSDVKEDPCSSEEQINAAQKKLDAATTSVDYTSEATHLARMNWWTVEYGLVGDQRSPKIYGAGLLSSVGESYHCLGEGVRKIPFTYDCVNVSYDITRPQPQLFVTPDFPTLRKVLEEVSATMAFRKGGLEGLAKAKQAGTVTTAQLDSGAQISGVLIDCQLDARGEPCFLRFSGPTQLAYGDQELKDQGTARHRDGFSTPIGKLAVSGKSASALSESELEQLGFHDGKKAKLRYESGVEVEGVLKSVSRSAGKALVFTFTDCTVRRDDQLLFRPEWGDYDLVCGLNVTMVFGGSADRARYLASTGGFHQSPQRPKSNLTDANRTLAPLYARVRELRESARQGAELAIELSRIHEQLEVSHPDDWLLRLELLELNALHSLQASWEPAARARLAHSASSAADRKQMIARGLELL